LARERRAFGVYFLQCGSGALKISSLSFLFNKNPLAGSCPRLSSISRRYPAMPMFQTNYKFAGDITQSPVMNNLLSKRVSRVAPFTSSSSEGENVSSQAARYISYLDHPRGANLENLIRTLSGTLWERISDIYAAARAAAKNRPRRYKHLHIIGSIFVLAPAVYSILCDTCAGLAALSRYRDLVFLVYVSRPPSSQSVLCKLQNVTAERKTKESTAAPGKSSNLWQSGIYRFNFRDI